MVNSIKGFFYVYKYNQIKKFSIHVYVPIICAIK
jgi:hypothetical protein